MPFPFPRHHTAGRSGVDVLKQHVKSIMFSATPSPRKPQERSPYTNPSAVGVLSLLSLQFDTLGPR